MNRTLILLGRFTPLTNSPSIWMRSPNHHVTNQTSSLTWKQAHPVFLIEQSSKRPLEPLASCPDRRSEDILPKLESRSEERSLVRDF